jgi:transglutaminase-like putative cysteine protease
MELRIEHDTLYRFSDPAVYSVQYLRLTPRHNRGQDVWDWTVRSSEPLVSFVDAFGNIVHLLTVARPHREIRVGVRGNAVTRELHGILPVEPEPFPTRFFLRRTLRTTAGAALTEFAEGFASGLARNQIGTLHTLMSAIHEQVVYEIGATNVHSTADEAFMARRGVCQDHAHLFIACCRHLGVPSRYVSGYLWADPHGREYDASHAWAEAYVDDLGWVSFDVSNAVSTTEAYLRVAVGLDYASAAPILGVRRGGGSEDLDVRVRVSEFDSSVRDPSRGAQQ